jgi:hypothetical protein
MIVCKYGADALKCRSDVSGEEDAYTFQAFIVDFIRPIQWAALEF